MTINEAATKWGVTPASVGVYLRAGRVYGAVKRDKTVWSIPDDALKPNPLKKGRPALCGSRENVE